MHDARRGADGVPFGDRVAAAVIARESQIVLGIDPDPSALWPLDEDDVGAAAGSRKDAAARAARAVLSHCRALIDAAGPACVAVKLQLACFERLGAPGRDALGEAVEHACEAGLIVIADGKRGDIDVSVRAYAESLFGGFQTPFGRIDGLGVDAATINPLMGGDTLRTALAVARERAGGLLVLVRTSNPGAADVLDLQLEQHAVSGSRTVWERIASLVAELGAQAEGSGIADVGAVVGATEPDHLERARELMPRALFLLPGVGAQGGRVEELAPVFASGRAGGLISASRSIANAHRVAGEDPANAARAEAERLRELAWRLSE
ncbi:MAG: orotidine-5'-phosphate decarboxylase [Solirubrobacteraceae bacterium]